MATFLLTACAESSPLDLGEDVQGMIRAGSGTVRTAIQGAKDTVEWTKMTVNSAADELEAARKKGETIIGGIKKLSDGAKEVASGAGL